MKIRMISIVLSVFLVTSFAGCLDFQQSKVPATPCGNLLLSNLDCEEAQFVKITSIITRHLTERTGEATPAGTPVSISLSVQDGIGKEGYRIENTNGSWRITGNDKLGLYYGVGRFLHEGSYSADGFLPGGFTGTSIPEQPIRGMYLANPGWNWYGYSEDDAVRFYIEDLLLWGCNSIMVITPGPGTVYGYEGGTQYLDEHKPAYIQRVIDMVTWANELSMTTAVLTVANSSWHAGGTEMLADWEGGKNGYTSNLAAHGHYETCPSSEGGMEHIIKGQKAALLWFKESAPTYICLWPYDGGGCTCANCAPWGSNGFVRIAKELSSFLREEFPTSSIMLSTWYFDHFTTGEYSALKKDIEENGSEWVDIIMAHFGDKVPPVYSSGGTIGNLPVVDFPEISMYGMVPYGGFGANPIPSRVQSYFDDGKGVFSGGYPYSEGIYDDLNKIMYIGLLWGGLGDTYEIAARYCSYEFGSLGADAANLVSLLETGTVRTHYDEAYRVQNYPQRAYPLSGESRFKISRTKDIDEAYATAVRLNGALPESVRKGWRWQILYLRTVIDYELYHNNFYLNEKSDAALEALIVIYGGETNYYTTPPSRRIIKAARGMYLS